MIEDLWYKNAVIYSLSVDSFMDSNADGMGDLPGIERRLDYLAGLGVTALWLTPFQPSPRRDHGYDITDYYGVDPKFGTLGDFVQLTHQARQRGIGVIMDLVVNHTSDQHPWFLAARRDRSSRYRDYYVWSETKPKVAHEGIIFEQHQEATWSHDPVAGAWYHHRFFDFQPDLNTENPAVQEEIQRVMGFWLQLGISGFRLDAVPFIIESGNGEDRAMRFEYLRHLNDFVRWRTGTGLLLAEANVPLDEHQHYFGREGDRMHMVFNFQVNQALFYAMASEDTEPLIFALRGTAQKPHFAQWASFLRNHDELDLGRLDDGCRQRVYEAFAPDPSMRLYDRGIRRRLAPMLKGDRRRLELAYSLMFSLPGTPVLRYGDEIGMGDDLRLPQRKAVRTTMQWTTDPHGGFTRAETSGVPAVSEGAFSYRHVNVATQLRDPGSLLNWMERMIRLRKACPEIGWGAYEVLDVGHRDVLALKFRWRCNELLLLHNFSAAPRNLRLRLDAPGGLLTSLLSQEQAQAGSDGAHHVALEGYGYRWLRLGPLLNVVYSC